MQVREIVDITSSRDRTPHEQRLSRREPLPVFTAQITHHLLTSRRSSPNNGSKFIHAASAWEQCMYIHCDTNVYVTVLILFVSCNSCDCFYTGSLYPGNALYLSKDKLILNNYIDHNLTVIRQTTDRLAVFRRC